jgi:cobalt-zinc-cadmium efflux system outer membrane protein
VQVTPLRKYQPLPSTPLSIEFIPEQGAEKNKEVLGLDAAIALCMANNHALRIAREEINIAEGQLQQAKLLNNPEIEFSIGSSSAAGSVLNVAGSLLQPISLFWPKRQVTIAVAEAVVERAKAEIQRLAWEIRVNLKRTYLQTIAQQNETAFFKQSQKIIDKLSSTTTRLKAGGEVSRLGELLVQSEVVEAKARLIEAESSLAKKRSELAILLGIPLLPQLPEGTPELPDSLQLDALQLNRAFTAGNAEIYVRDAEIRLAELEHAAALQTWWPTPKLGVTAERDSDNSKVFGGLFSLELPLFNHNEGEIESRTALLAKARIEREQSQFVGQQSLDRLSIVLRRTMQLIALYRDEGLPAVEENLLLVQRAIDAGELSALELIAARRQAIATQLAYLQMRFAVVEVLLDLEAVLGTPVFELRFTTTATQENVTP